jgi:hypothetical protein
MSISLHNTAAGRAPERQNEPNRFVRMITGRRMLIGAGALAVALGLAFNWRWLTAIGVTPILVSVLPCVSMCALGLCMSRSRGASCHASSAEPNASPDSVAETERATPPSHKRHG